MSEKDEEDKNNDKNQDKRALFEWFKTDENDSVIQTPELPQNAGKGLPSTGPNTQLQKKALKEILESFQPTPMKEKTNFKRFGSFIKHTLSIKTVNDVSNAKKAQKNLKLGSSKGKKIKAKNKFKESVKKARQIVGATVLLNEIRARENAYAQVVDDLLAKVKTYEEHPYVALRKKIEAMTKSGKEEYKIEYEPMYNKRTIFSTGIPIYATVYDDERKRQARRRNFMFGHGLEDRFDPDSIDAYILNSKEPYDKHHWRHKVEINLAMLGLVFTTSNLFRFPRACYLNGGIIFFFVYCFLVVTLIQPLMLFEMLIGQFSLKGEWGFAKLNRYAKGFPYALTFMSFTFITLNNAFSGYAGLYSIGSYLRSPGDCHPEWDECIPYNEPLDNYKAQLIKKRMWLETNFNEKDQRGFYNAPYLLSTEYFFRIYILNWKERQKQDFHWVYLIVYLMVCLAIIPSSIHTYLTSSISKIWIYLTCILPIVLTAVLFHQYAFRGGLHSPAYFSIPNWKQLATLTFWHDAFEMAFSTVGVGYGVIIRVTDGNDFRYSETVKSSWIVSIFSMIFCWLCAMVVYTELALVGSISEAKDFIHIISEGFGVSFVCLSGAFLKAGPAWVFATFFGAIAVICIWPQIVATQMAFSIVYDNLPLESERIKTGIGVAFTIIAEIILISFYVSHASFATNNTYDLFGGSGAACMIMLAQLGIALGLMGFSKFMSDLEIMMNQKLPFTFQIQMKYFVIPTMMLAFLLITITWFHSPPVLIENQKISFDTYYIGTLLNAMPMLIILFFAYSIFRKRNKIYPKKREARFLLTSKAKAVNIVTHWKQQTRWKERRKAVTAPKNVKLSPLRSSVNFMDKNIAEDIFDTHSNLKRALRNLFEATKAKVLWHNAANKIIANNGLKSVAKLTRYIVREENTKRMALEATFLKNIIRQCSLSDVTACCSRKLERANVQSQELYLIDRLLKSVSISSEDEGSNEGSEDSLETWLRESQPKPFISTKTYPSSSSTSSGSTVYRKVVGKIDRTKDEVWLDLAVRIKKGLGISYEEQFTQLAAIRRLRLIQELRSTSRYDAPPKEHFIKINITKKNENSVMVELRVIVIKSSNHFVLKRLPYPRPMVLRTTMERIESLIDVDWDHKLFQFVISQLKQTMWKTDLKALIQKPLNRTSLMDNLDSDIYSFIDPLRTVVVVVQTEQELAWRKNKWKWLTPTTKRQNKLEDIPLLHEPTFKVEEVTMASLAKRVEEQERIFKMLNDPSDIVFHFSKGMISNPSDNHPSISESASSRRPTIVSNNSSSSEEDLENSQNKKTMILKKIKRPIAGRYAVEYQEKAQIVDETRMNQQRKDTIKKNFRIKYEQSYSNEEINYLKSVKHLTQQDWQKKKVEFDDSNSIYIIKERPTISMTQSVSILPESTLEFLERKQSKIKMVKSRSIPNFKDRFSMHPIWSKGDEKLQVNYKNTRTGNLQSTYGIESSTTDFFQQSTIDFSNLKNDNEQYAYYSIGKLLIVDRRQNDGRLIMAESMDSIASKRRRKSIRSSRIAISAKLAKSNIRE